MRSILVSGATGFIGRNLLVELRKQQVPYTALERNELTSPTFTADGSTLLHLANAHSDAAANVNLARDILRIADKAGIQTIIITQTFASLTGPGNFDVNEFNCGLRPRFIDEYTAGKLAVEKYVLTHAPARAHVIFVYLPAVLGEGGSWDRLFVELRDCEKLNIPVTAAARANHIAVEEVVQRLVMLLREDRAHRTGSERRIWVSARSRSMAWPDFIEHNVRPCPSINVFLPWLRFSDQVIKHLACSVVLSRRLPTVIRHAVFSRSSRTGTDGDPVQPQPAWYPGPFLRFLMCEQSYIRPVY